MWKRRQGTYCSFCVRFEDLRVSYHRISRLYDGLGINFLGMFSVPIIRADGVDGADDIEPDSRKTLDLRPSLTKPLISQANTVRTVCYLLAKSSSLVFIKPLHHEIICALWSDMLYPDPTFDHNFKAWCETGDTVRQLRRPRSLRNKNVGCRRFDLIEDKLTESKEIFVDLALPSAAK